MALMTLVEKKEREYLKSYGAERERERERETAMVSQKNTQGKWRQKEKERKEENTKLGIQKQILK